MENFIEKLKTVDKKVWIGVGIGAAVLIILIVALIIGLGNKKPTGGNQGGSQNGTQYGTETEGTEVFGTEDVTEVLGTETTETEMGTETEMTESESESQTQGVGGTTVTQRPDVDGVTQQPVTTKPDGEEILGMGTIDTPYFETPDLSNMTLTTVSIPAGQKLYYNIYRVGGMYLTINDSDVYVIDSAGKRHDASNGKVSFKVENKMANQYVSFQIGNKGTSAKTFTIKFSNPKGTWQNPEKVSSIISQSEYTVHSPAGNEVGYYYEYVAEQDGNIKFYISGTKTCGISVTNGRNSMNRTNGNDGKTDDIGTYVELQDVKKGDAIKIQVFVYPDSSWNYPAADITWKAHYFVIE